MVDLTIRWRQRLQILLRLFVFGAVAYRVFDWLDAVLYQAIHGHFAAALSNVHSSREAYQLVLVVAFAVMLLIFERRLTRWLAPIPLRHCHECGYAMKGLHSTRCPECGAELPAAMITGVPPSQSHA